MSDAVEKPEVTGPISAIGAIKHPDSNTPRVAKASNLLIIDSPFRNHPTFFLFSKKGNLISLRTIIYNL